MLTPQEIQVWYILPALRKEIATKLKKQEFKQKEIARIMDITPAAVSQYLHKKRANMNIRIKEEIIDTAIKNILKNDEDYQEALQEALEEVSEAHTICEVHKKIEKVTNCCGLCKK